MQPTPQNDLSAYLSRIGVPKGASASLDLLRDIVVRHTAKVPFESLDPFLGRPVSLELSAVISKRSRAAAAAIATNRTC